MQQVLDELDKCVNLIAVWVIMKGVEMVGRVTARYSQSGATTFVTFQMFVGATNDGNGSAVLGYERVTGWGYNRTTAGIGKILSANRERLKREYGIELDGPDWNIANTWEKDLASSGYKVIRAI